MDQPVYVYAIRMQGTEFVKIGISENVYNRLASLQTANPYPLVLEGVVEFSNRPDAVAHETWLHSVLREYHARGEWFEAPAEILDHHNLVGVSRSRLYDPRVMSALENRCNTDCLDDESVRCE